MPNDPHRDALAAALARVDALEQENRTLRIEQAPPRASQPAQAPDSEVIEHAGAPTERAKQPVKCAACTSTRTVEGRFARKIGTLSVGIQELTVTRARVCADCGQVSLLLDERSRVWLQANYLTALLSEHD